MFHVVHLWYYWDPRREKLRRLHGTQPCIAINYGGVVYRRRKNFDGRRASLQASPCRSQATQPKFGSDSRTMNSIRIRIGMDLGFSFIFLYVDSFQAILRAPSL